MPPGFDIERYLHPCGNPWPQRLCLALDGDFFRAVGKGRAAMAIDTIDTIDTFDTFARQGIRLAAVKELPADPAQCVTCKETMPSGARTR